MDDENDLALNGYRISANLRSRLNVPNRLLQRACGLVRVYASERAVIFDSQKKDAASGVGEPCEHTCDIAGPGYAMLEFKALVLPLEKQIPDKLFAR